MSFDPIAQIERDVEAILPFRQRYLSLTPDQRENEIRAVILNTNMKISMSQTDNDEYWSSVIEEADRRIASHSGEGAHYRKMLEHGLRGPPSEKDN